MAMIAPAGLPPLQAVDNRLLDPATKMFAHEWMLMLPRSEKARLPQVVAGLETAGLKVHSFTLRSKTYVLISASVKKLVEVATTENYPMQLAAESDDTLLGSLQGDELDTYKEFIAMESSGMHTWFTSADLQEIRLCPFSSKLIKFFDYDEELMDSELLDGAQVCDAPGLAVPAPDAVLTTYAVGRGQAVLQGLGRARRPGAPPDQARARGPHAAAAVPGRAAKDRRGGRGQRAARAAALCARAGRAGRRLGGVAGEPGTAGVCVP